MPLSRRMRLALFMLCLLGGAAAAHEIRPAVITVVFAPDNRYEATIVTNMEALLAGRR